MATYGIISVEGCPQYVADRIVRNLKNSGVDCNSKLGSVVIPGNKSRRTVRHKIFKVEITDENYGIQRFITGLMDKDVVLEGNGESSIKEMMRKAGLLDN